MDCNVIKDLIPLYIDKCCSEETTVEVEKHLKSCKDCNMDYERMCKWSEKYNNPQKIESKKKTTKINLWKASILQSVVMFLSFVLIAFGVREEAATPTGLVNGLWALNLVIPATGFMLSLVNWYFVRLYSSKKAFSAFSSFITFSITLIAYVWGWLHYELSSIQSIKHFIWGITLSAFFCIASAFTSHFYAKPSGKE